MLQKLSMDNTNTPSDDDHPQTSNDADDGDFYDDIVDDMNQLLLELDEFQESEQFEKEKRKEVNNEVNKIVNLMQEEEDYKLAQKLQAEFTIEQQTYIEKQRTNWINNQFGMSDTRTDNQKRLCTSANKL